MPILHTINEDIGIVVSSIVGVITDELILDSYKDLYENKRWKPGFHEVVDLRNADMSAVSADGVRRLSALVESYVSGKCEGFRTAIVASDDLPYGLARLYENISTETPERVMVFRNLQDALQWINVEGLEFA